MVIKRYLGPSRDGRTNRWRVICPCGTAFTPLTTMFRQAHPGLLEAAGANAGRVSR